MRYVNLAGYANYTGKSIIVRMPAMVLYGRTAVHGEVYAADDATLERIDRLKGHPNYFIRSRITL